MTTRSSDIVLTVADLLHEMTTPVFGCACDPDDEKVLVPCAAVRGTRMLVGWMGMQSKRCTFDILSKLQFQENRLPESLL